VTDPCRHEHIHDFYTMDRMEPTRAWWIQLCQDCDHAKMAWRWATVNVIQKFGRGETLTADDFAGVHSDKTVA